MKKKIYYLTRDVVYWGLNKLFVLFNHATRLKNAYKPKILIYTDSRGFNVANKWGKIYFDSYIPGLMLNFQVKYYVCPEKHTTIVDFLNVVDSLSLANYDAVILHCGVVDFSPRPLSNIDFIKKSKSSYKRFPALFEANSKYYSNPFKETYKGEPTITLYANQYLINDIIPSLLKINNLLWISSNPILEHWDGNYEGGRPENINHVVESFDAIMAAFLPNVLSLRNWNESEIKSYTIDNIHFTKSGFRKIMALVTDELYKITKKN